MESCTRTYLAVGVGNWDNVRTVVIRCVFVTPDLASNLFLEGWIASSLTGRYRELEAFVMLLYCSVVLQITFANCFKG